MLGFGTLSIKNHFCDSKYEENNKISEQSIATLIVVEERDAIEGTFDAINVEVLQAVKSALNMKFESNWAMINFSKYFQKHIK